MSSRPLSNHGNGIGRCGEFLQYDFTPEELAEFSKELARHTLERSRLEQQKREVDAQLKSQIEAENTQIAILANNISTGHTQRMIDCAILWHNPGNGRATIRRIDTGERVRERKMTYEEMQDRLPFDPPAPPSPPQATEEEPKRREVKALIEGGEIAEAEFVDVEEGDKTAGAGGAAD